MAAVMLGVSSALFVCTTVHVGRGGEWTGVGFCSEAATKGSREAKTNSTEVNAIHLECMILQPDALGQKLIIPR